MWVDLGGRKFNTDLLFCLSPVTGDDDGDGDQCIVFGAGASPVDGGFLIDLPFSEAFAILQKARFMEIADAIGDPLSPSPPHPLSEADQMSVDHPENIG
jgi:hypothetical protein